MSQGRLQRELRKKQPFDTLEEEAALSLVRTSDRVQLRFARLFREHGLTSAQYNILRILRGEARPLQCMEIAERMLTEVPGITGLMDRLAAHGLVARERSTTDRRAILVTLTAAAQQLLTQLDQPVRDLHKQVLGHLSQPELQILIGLLAKVRQPDCDPD